LVLLVALAGLAVLAALVAMGSALSSGECAAHAGQCKHLAHR
jgi:hypothetical protein